METGTVNWTKTITTPEGTLTLNGAYNEITGWETEPLIKAKEDFELFRKYNPVAEKLDFSPVAAAKEKLGDKGITRCGLWGYGQSGPWQASAVLLGLRRLFIMRWTNRIGFIYVLQSLTDRQLRFYRTNEGDAYRPCRDGRRSRIEYCHKP